MDWVTEVQFDHLLARLRFYDIEVKDQANLFQLGSALADITMLKSFEAKRDATLRRLIAMCEEHVTFKQFQP